MATNITEKVLRVGVIHNGKVIEERLVLKKGPISVGASRAAMFNIPLEGLPPKVEIIALKGGRYHLVCGDGVTCRVTAGGTTFEHRAMHAASGRAPALYPLSPDALGRVEVGPVTILFQFVTPPPALPRVQLPELARVRWSGRIDKPFAAIVMWIVLIHVGFVMAVQSAPLPMAPDMVIWQDEKGHIIKVLIPPQKDDPPDEAAGESVEKPVEPEKPEKRPEQGRNTGAPANDKPSIEQTREKVRNSGIMAILTAKPIAGSAVSKMFSGGDTVNVQEVFMGVSTGVASLDVGLERGNIRIGGGGSGGPIVIDKPGAGRDINVGGGSAGEKPKVGPNIAAAFGKMDIEPPQVEGCLAKDEVTKVVKPRLRGLQDCYERELKKITSLAGKLTITFMVNGEGTVTDARVESDSMGSPAVADCIVTRLRRFKFPASDCASVTVSYPFIFMKAQ